MLTPKAIHDSITESSLLDCLSGKDRQRGIPTNLQQIVSLKPFGSGWYQDLE